MFSFRKARKDVKTEEKLKERSAVALLYGSILRAFAWGWSMLPPGQSFSLQFRSNCRRGDFSIFI